MKKLVCHAVLAFSFCAAQAAPVTLDLTSGSHANLNGSAVFDTYTEDGFRLRMVRAGDHYDLNYIGDLTFHNGPSNGDDASLVLDFFGASFNLANINIAGYAGGANSITLTGSNGVTQVLSGLGTLSVAGMGNVTSVIFDIDQDGGAQAVGLSELNVDTTPTQQVPVPGTLGLLGLGLPALVLARRRRA
ncbi:PEP-CTERM sorting domain-containing protein [Pseudoduganella sp. OTU4001]|uniref:PEP-CTERM sorting domain-containing protein n=1 Tax=Pseudoduganella sp. OTU4001 TaxID=3043854 RepID=UPI00313C71F6